MEGPKKNLLLTLRKSVPDNEVSPEAAAAVKADMAAIAAMQGLPPSNVESVAAVTAYDPINSPESQVVRTALPQEPLVADTLPKKPRKKRESRELTREETIQVNRMIESGALVETARYTESADDLPIVPKIQGFNSVATEQPEPSTDKPIRTLFVGCLPLGRNVKYAHELIARAAQTVENDLEIHHVKLAPFGTGGASLAAQLRNDIVALGETFDLVLLTRTPEARDCEQVLCSLAQNVIIAV